MTSKFLRRKSANSSIVEARTVSGTIVDILIILVLIGVMIVCFVPLWYVLVASVSDGKSLFATDGLILKPVGEWNFDGYKLIMQDNSILIGYRNTLLYVVSTTAIGLLMNVMTGYALSRKTRYNGLMTLFVVITMMFSGGLIPSYMIVRELGILNTPLAVILPTCTNAFFIIMTANAFRGVPQQTIEAAELDGANHFQVMMRVGLPQCKSTIAVVVLYNVVMQWNSWFQAMVYLPTARQWWPLQLYIREFVANNTAFLQSSNPDYSRFLVQFCLIVVATLPILVAFPFFLNTIEKGVITGGVKE